MSGASCTRSRTRCTGWARRSRSSHIERMMLLFSVWEGRNGARPESSNTSPRRLAESVTPALLDRLAERHGIEPRARGRMRSQRRLGRPRRARHRDDLDRGAQATTVEEFLEAVMPAAGTIAGGHGSSVKLAHAVGALALNAYRGVGPHAAVARSMRRSRRCSTDGDDGPERHDRIVGRHLARRARLSDGARRGALDLDALRRSATASARCSLAGGDRGAVRRRRAPPRRDARSASASCA